MSTGFHPHSHLHSLRRQVSVKLFRFLAVLQPPFFILSGLGIHKRNLLEARVVITSYNQHVRLLSPSLPGCFGTTKSTRGLGAGIVMESISLRTREGQTRTSSWLGRGEHGARRAQEPRFYAGFRGCVGLDVPREYRRFRARGPFGCSGKEEQRHRWPGLAEP